MPGIGYLRALGVSVPLYLIGPPMRRLELYYGSLTYANQHCFTDDLTAISLLARNLEVLTLYTCGGGNTDQLEVPVQGLICVITSCPHMHRLKVFGEYGIELHVTVHLAKCLSLLPRLTSLTLYIPTIRIPRDAHLSLPSLESLELASSGENIAALVRSAFLPSVRTLSLRFTRGPDLVDESVRRLSRSLEPSNLRTVRIWFDEGDSALTSTSLSQLARPFLQCHEMMHFSVYSVRCRFPWADVYDDEPVTDVTQSWPKLREFLFNFGNQRLLKPGATSSTVLEQFAANCPALEQLVLPYIDDISYGGTDPVYELRVEPQRRLKTLLIGRADVKSTKECFAGYLLKLFPGLLLASKYPKDCAPFPFHQLYDEDLWTSLGGALYEEL